MPQPTLYELFMCMPTDVQYHVFSLMDAIDLCRAAQTCKSWHRLCQDHILWKGLYQRMRWKLPEKHVKFWKSEFIRRYTLHYFTANHVTNTRLYGHSESLDVKCVAVHGDMLVTGSADCTVRIWSLSHMKEVYVLEGHTRIVRCLHVPSDRMVISGSQDATVRVWQQVDGRISRDNGNPSEPCNSSNNGSMDNIWAPMIWKCTNVLSGGHVDTLCHITMHSKYNQLLTAGLDGRLLSWDMNSLDNNSVCKHSSIFRTGGAFVTTMYIDEDAGEMLTGHMDGTIVVWKVVPPTEDNPSQYKWLANNIYESIMGIWISALCMDEARIYACGKCDPVQRVPGIRWIDRESGEVVHEELYEEGQLPSHLNRDIAVVCVCGRRTDGHYALPTTTIRLIDLQCHHPTRQLKYHLPYTVTSIGVAYNPPRICYVGSSGVVGVINLSSDDL